MNNKIKIYYIPENLNIKKGQIYTLYINKNNNLDLSSILEDEKTFNINSLNNNFCYECQSTSRWNFRSYADKWGIGWILQT